MATRSNARVCGRLLTGTEGPNPAGGMDVCLLWVFCWQVEVSATGWSLALRSPTECGVCLSVIVEPRRGGLGPQGLSS